MKKELFAALLLSVILIASVGNGILLTELTQSVSQRTDEAALSARDGDWESASAQAREALKSWEKNEKYFHTVLGHRDIDAVTLVLNDLLCSVSQRNYEDTLLAAARIREGLRGIGQAEKIKFGNIF